MGRFATHDLTSREFRLIESRIAALARYRTRKKNAVSREAFWFFFVKLFVKRAILIVQKPQKRKTAIIASCVSACTQPQPLASSSTRTKVFLSAWCTSCTRKHRGDRLCRRAG